MTDNVDIIKASYAAAEVDGLDADAFAAFFGSDGYFLDEASGMRWTGREVREPIAALVAAFPDMHRELLRFHKADDVVVVELKLQGTHRGAFRTPIGTLQATGRTFDVPCCDVFRLEDGKVASFHCYNEFSTWLQQLGSLTGVGDAERD